MKVFWGIVAAGAVATCAVAAPINLVSDRATYEISLARTEPGGPVAARGRTVVDFRDTCTGWTTAQRFLADVTNSDGSTVRNDLVATSWESKDGRAMRFSVKNSLDGRTAQHFEGSAELAASGGTGTVKLNVPQGKNFALPSGAILPTEHTLAVLRAAASGTNSERELVFQGGDKSDLYEATILIGRTATEAEMAADRAHDPSGLIAHVHARNVLISYFAYGSRTTAPEYEVAYRLYDNGVVTAMSLIYPTFTLRASLSKLEKLSPSC